MSLANCIKRAGKALDKKDIDNILTKRDELVAKGMDEVDADNIALKQAEDAIQSEIDDIFDRSGIAASKEVPEGVPVEIDERIVDSNQFINDVDNELDGIDSILGCLYR